MKIKVLDGETLGGDLSLEPIEVLGDCEIYGRTNEEELLERIRDAEVLVLNKIKLRGEILEKAEKLRLICVAATGYDNIDIPYCREHGIAVCNVVGYSSHSVAQLTLALVLSLSVHLTAYRDFVTSGAYTKSGVANRLTPVYYELFGKTWGIVGCGNIGKEVAAAAEALGCRVIVHKRTPSKEFECVTLETLCKTADIVTIHTPLTEETKGMIDEKMLSVMKPDVILVNGARGAVTDEAAIARAVKEKRIGAFGTDVYSVEPFDKGHPFYEIMSYENVCLTPHMAWGSYEARCRCVREIAENIKSFYGGSIRNRVDLA